MSEPFDQTRARLDGPDLFERYRVPEQGTPLRSAKLSPSTELMVIDRGGQSRTFILRQLTYHHVAQGTLADEPYVVSF